MKLNQLKKIKGILLFLSILILLNSFVLAEGGTLVIEEPVEICGEEDEAIVPNEGLYDEIIVDDVVTICEDGATIESHELVEVTDEGLIDGEGQHGEDGVEEEPGGDGEDGHSIEIYSGEVVVEGLITSSGGDGGDGGDAGGNRDGGDGGDAGNSGDIRIESLMEEITVDGNILAEGGSGGSGGSGGPGGGSSAGVGGDGEIISDIPIVNSSEMTEDFVTGILFQSEEGGSFDGSQPLVFATQVTTGGTGLKGIYDYEIRVPASLSVQIGGTESVTIFSELQ